jgi:nucleoside-diphosphate-sugar epimerase
LALTGHPGTPIVTDEARVRPAASEVERLVCDNRLAAELAGWRPTVSLDEGLSRTIAWVGDNLGRYRHGYQI